MDRFTKQLIYMRGYLQGCKYHAASEALDMAQNIHVGVRKDGITPEFAHQIAMACYAITILPLLTYPEETLSAIFLHDAIEDYNITRDEIKSRFGEIVHDAVFYLTKLYICESDNKIRNKIKPEHYFRGVGHNEIASIVKGIDRMHNQQTMVGVFSHEGQIHYIEESETYILPMLKVARKKFPYQTMAYLNVKTVLESQIEMLRVINGMPVPNYDD